MSMPFIFGDDRNKVPCKSLFWSLATMSFLWNRGPWIFVYLYTRKACDRGPYFRSSLGRDENMPSLYLSVFSFLRRKKKRSPDHSFLKLKSGCVNQTHAHYFTCTIVSISIVPWFTEAIEWSLSVIAPGVFMTAIICSVALIYVWRINPVNLKVLVRENININTAKMHYLSY